MRLLHASASIPLNQVNIEGASLTWHHLSPVEYYLGVVVANLVEIDNTIALQVLQEVKVNLKARGDSQNCQSHAQTAIHINRTRGHWSGTSEAFVVLQCELVGENLALTLICAESLNIKTMLYSIS